MVAKICYTLSRENYAKQTTTQMKPTLTLLLALLLIGGIGLLFPVLAIVIVAVAMIYALIYIAQQCKELNRNGFGKKSEL